MPSSSVEKENDNFETIEFTRTNEKRRIDALLITNPYNRSYMTGFTGTAGVALFRQMMLYLLQTFVILNKRKRKLKGFVSFNILKQLLKKSLAQVKNMKVNTIGFEKDDMSFGLYELYNKEIEAELKPVSGLVEKLRMVKTADEFAILKKAAKIADDAFDTYHYVYSTWHY